MGDIPNALIGPEIGEKYLDRDHYQIQRGIEGKNVSNFMFTNFGFFGVQEAYYIDFIRKSHKYKGLKDYKVNFRQMDSVWANDQEGIRLRGCMFDLVQDSEFAKNTDFYLSGPIRIHEFRPESRSLLL